MKNNFQQIKKILLFAVVVLLLSSCAVLVGTRTLYTASNIEKIHKYGYINVDNDNNLSTVYPRTNAVFTSTIIETFAKYSLEMPMEIYDNISFERPDTDKIISICKENNLDGLLLSKLTFVYPVYYIAFTPITPNIDTEVEMKLFNKDGRVIAITRHNTLKGSDYMLPPTTERTIHDATYRALKKIIKIVNKE
jgi:hypothetical protein